MSEIDPIQTQRLAGKSQSTALPVIKRIRLPQRLRDDGWWLCPTPERPSARILPFPRSLTPAPPRGARA